MVAHCRSKCRPTLSRPQLGHRRNGDERLEVECLQQRRAGCSRGRTLRWLIHDSTITLRRSLSVPLATAAAQVAPASVERTMTPRHPRRAAPPWARQSRSEGRSGCRWPRPPRSRRHRIKHAGLKSENFVFPSRIHDSPHLGTRQYARILEGWVEELCLDPAEYWTHSMRRTKATLIYLRTKNLRAVQLLPGHSKLSRLCATSVSRLTTPWRSRSKLTLIAGAGRPAAGQRRALRAAQPSGAAMSTVSFLVSLRQDS